MTMFIAQAPAVGNQDLNTVYTAGSLGAPSTGANSSTTVLPSAILEGRLGQIVQAQDFDTPTGNAVSGGGGEFIFLAIPTSTAITKGLLYYWNGAYSVTIVPTTLATTTTSGSPVAAATVAATSNATSIQYAWFQIQGRCQLLKIATISINANVPLYSSSTTAGKVQASGVTLRTIIGIRSANTATATTGASILFAYLHRPSLGPGV